MNFISREQVLEIIDQHHLPLVRRQIEKLFYFPAPNPKMLDGRNIMGQTEEEFWNAADDER